MARTTPTVGWICTDRGLSTIAKIILDEKYEEGLMKLENTDVYCVGRIGSVTVVISCLSDLPDSASFEHMVQNMVTSFSDITCIIIISLGCEIPVVSIPPGDIAINLEIRHHELDSSPKFNIVQRAFNVLQGEVGEDGHWLSNDLSSAFSNHKELLQLVQGSKSDLPGYPHIHYEKIDLNLIDIHTETATINKHFDTILAGISIEISYESADCF